MGEPYDMSGDPTLGGNPDYYGIDTAPTGAGGDPYGTGDTYVPAGGAEEWSTGMLPGGADGQLSPYSPGGGFDYTNLFKGLPSWMMARSAQAGALPNAGALAVGGDPSIPYGGGGVPDVFTGGSSSFNEMGVHYPRGCGGARGTSARATVGALVQKIKCATGLRVTARSITNLIVRYGFRATAAMTGAEPAALLAIFMQQKGTTHHRRGPGLYTLARKFRKYESLKRTVARVLGRGGHRVHHRRRHHFARRHRRK